MKISRKKFLERSLAGAVALSVAAPAAEALAAAGGRKRIKGKRVLLIGLDGICVEGLRKARTPRIDGLLAEGVASMSTRVVMPSVTLPNWTSHLTGSGPEQHGVVDNSWTKDKFVLPSVARDADGYYPSAFKVLKDAIPEARTAFYYNWINLFYPYNERYIDESLYLENDAYVPYYDRALEFMRENRDHPTLVFLYSVHTDHAGHRYKWMSPEYIRSIEEADAEIGRLLDRMREEGLYDDSHIMFLSDHGGIEYGHGGVTTHEMIVPWGIAGPGIARGVEMTSTNNTVNTAAVVLHLFGVERPDCWTGEVPDEIFARR